MVLRIGATALVAGALCLFGPLLAQDEPLEARAAVQSQQVYVGQNFLLQLQIHGTDQPDPVDIGPLERDFVVSEAGGGASNSTSVSIVNGRMSRQVQRSYNLNYRLAARRAGDLQIPALGISSAGRSARTQPIALRVMPPQENDDFKLRLTLSEARAYVGQPVTLTVDWYIGREIREYSFTMPLLEDSRFEIIEPPSPSAGQAAAAVLEIQLGDRRATGVTMPGELAGRKYTLLRFRKLLIPREPGSFALPPATVTFTAASPSQARQRDLFDDFLGGGLFSGAFGRRAAVETLAIPSGRPRLEVLPLPSAGRPAGFNGWIGQFQIQAEAKPTAVVVGEPITLSMSVEGARALPALPLPRLDVQTELTRGFKVPREIGAGEDRGGARHFTQTLRARHAGVSAIPPIELPFFDPAQGEYRIARSEPIPVAVQPSRIVTADDAEGAGAGAGEPRQLTVESSEQGIGHNYTDASALVPMQGGWAAWLRPLGPSWLGLALFGLPPLLFSGLLAARLHRQSPNAFRMRGRSPYARWRTAVAAVALDQRSGSEVAQGLLIALRAYLGSKLAGRGASAAAWTYVDTEARLAEATSRQGGRRRSVDAETLALLRSVFERCEAGSYAGGGAMDDGWVRQLVDDGGTVVDRIEEALR